MLARVDAFFAGAVATCEQQAGRCACKRLAAIYQ
jgi:hypothetical protein